MDVQEILELMKEMKNSGIASLDWEVNGEKLQLSRPAATIDPALLDSLADAQAQAAAQLTASRNLISVSGESVSTADEATEEAARPKGKVVSSPVVGVFYAAASPEQDPFVTIGSRVESGSPLGIIEAMKLMNEVISPCAGTIVDILVDNNQRVEYGQPLFVIEESLT